MNEHNLFFFTFELKFMKTNRSVVVIKTKFWYIHVLYSHFRDCEIGAFLSCDWIWDDEDSFPSFLLAEPSRVTRWLDQWEVATQWLGAVPLPASISSPPPPFLFLCRPDYIWPRRLSLQPRLSRRRRGGLPGQIFPTPTFLFNSEVKHSFSCSRLRCGG